MLTPTPAAASDAILANARHVPVMYADAKFVERANQLSTGRRIGVLTLAWNLGESCGDRCGPVLAVVALIGFGAVRSSKVLGGILVWRLQSHTGHERREHLARKLVGCASLCWRYMLADAGMTSQRLARSVTGIHLGACLNRRDAASRAGKTGPALRPA